MKKVIWGELLKKHLLRDFTAALATLNDSEHLIAKVELEVAPILEKIKPAALMTFSKDSCNLYKKWEAHKDECCEKLRLQYYEMRRTEKNVLVLFYNPVLLKEILQNVGNMIFLRGMGYQQGLSLERILHILKEKFADACPHEIGLFLGISREDVAGFIQGRRCLFCRYWKVYHQPQEANKLFRRYDIAKLKVIERLCQRRIPAAVSA